MSDISFILKHVDLFIFCIIKIWRGRELFSLRDTRLSNTEKLATVSPREASPNLSSKGITHTI